jgi:hypothetical protein
MTLRMNAADAAAPAAVCFVMPGYRPGALPWSAFKAGVAQKPSTDRDLLQIAEKSAKEQCNRLVSKGTGCETSAGRLTRWFDPVAKLLRERTGLPCGQFPQATMTELARSCDASGLNDDSSLEDWYVTCAKDESPASANGGPLQRVAVIALHAPQSFAEMRPGLQHIGITSIALEHGVASLKLTGLLDSGDYLVARVLGGHYQSGSETALSGDRDIVEIALTPLCSPRAMRLRDLEQQTENSVPALLESADSSCSVRAEVHQGWATVIVPWRPGRYALTIQPESSRESGSSPSVWGLSGNSFRGVWNGGREPPDIELRRSTVAFTWTPGCRYPREPKGQWCPKAVLADRAGNCDLVEPSPEGSPQGECRYHCRAESGSTLELPLQIQMRGHPKPSPDSNPNLWADDVWVEWLLKPHQTLHGQVASEERRLLVRSTCDPQHEQVESLRVFAAARQIATVPACTTSTMQVPGAGCNEELTFQYIGQRQFEASTLHLEQGVFYVPRPEESLQTHTIGLSLQAGVSSLAAEPKPLFIDKPWLYGGLYWEYRPSEWQWSLLFQLGVLLKHRWYAIETEDRDLPSQQEQRAMYFTVPIEAGTIFHLCESFAMAATAGIGIGHPLDAANERLVGDYAASLVTSVTARLLITQVLQFEALLRGSFFERVLVHELDFRGQPRTLDYSAWSGFLGLGLRWDFVRH